MKGQKKINIMLLSIYRNGGIRILFEYAKLLNKDGFDVRIYHTLVPYRQSENESIIRYLKRIKEKIHYLIHNKTYLKKYNYTGIRTQLVPCIKNLFVRKADITVFTYWPIAYALEKTYAAEGKIIYLIQAYETWDASLKMLHNTYKMGFTNVVTSKFLKNLIKEKSGADSEIVLNGIDFDKYKNENKVFGKNKITIGFIDYRVKFKGTKDIISALDKINVDYKGKINVVTFKSEETLYPRDYIDYYDNPDDDTIVNLYCRSDIFISASYEEGFYLVPAEAMACKCANISTNVGALKEYAEDGKSILFFKPGDVETLIEKIRYLLDNPDELKRISLEGFASVTEKLKWEKSVEKLKKFF